LQKERREEMLKISKRFKKYFQFNKYWTYIRKFRRPFSWINVESTSRCNLKCIMCPRLSYQPANKDMTMDTFKKISQDFHLFRMVDLTGWGEPLLHPELFEMVNICKKSLCSVKIGTNGLLLNEEKAEKVVKSGVDWMVFSIDGVTDKTYKEIEGADLNTVKANIRRLVEMKKESKTEYPLIDIDFVMLKNNIKELPMMVELAKSLGAIRFLVKSPDAVCKVEDIDLLLFEIDKGQNIDTEERDRCVKEAREIAKKIGIEICFLFSSFKPKPLKTCPINIEKNIFISWEGKVSPCCDLGHPVPGVINYDKVIENTEVVFGDINKGSILEIFNSKPYTSFRERMKKGIPKECRHCMVILGV